MLSIFGQRGVRLALQKCPILKINDALAESLVYTEGGASRKIELVFSEPAKDFYVYQNEPNPFMEETSVRIEIKPENTAETLTKWSLFDGTGNLIVQHTEFFKYGVHVLRLNAQDLGLSKPGFYFLKVETAMGVQTIKLLKMPN